MEPVISVVIPMYNADRFVREAIESVLNQTFSDIEVLVVDDCSTDRSVEIVEGMAADDQRIRLLRHEKNAGPAIARNTAFDVARGKYMACLDADDIFIPNALETLYKYAERTDADVVSANGTFVFEGEHMPTDFDNLSEGIYDGVPVKAATRLSSPDISIEVKAQRYLHGAYGLGHCWSKLYRRDFLNDNGIRFRVHAEDRCFTFECAMYARTYIRLPYFVNVYRRVKNSLSHQESTMKHLEDGVKGMSKFAADFDASMIHMEFIKERPDYRFQILNMQLAAVDMHEVMRYYPSSTQVGTDVIAAVDEAAREAYGEDGAFIGWLFHRQHLLYRRLLDLTRADR